MVHGLLFSPIAARLTVLGAERTAGVDELNGMLAAIEPRPSTSTGVPIRCVHPDRCALSYEERIFVHGEIVTRPRCWHDYFNALVWMTFPQIKAALNALHVDEARGNSDRGSRGALRDAATQFDESGIIVASADPSLLELLAKREWRPLFWERRRDVLTRMRFLVFGHGLYDALRAPFYRMCGRAALVEVDQRVVDADVGGQCAHVDPIVAERFAGRQCYPRPGALMALPLLGIPGVHAANACAAYYEDAVQFRPLPDSF
jgi:hypothetical protein